MYERLLKETERYLERRPEIVVPVKRVWDTMVKEGKANNFPVPSLMADFECLLEGDRRFEFMAEKKRGRDLGDEFDDSLEREDLEKLGFADGQLVKLRRIRIAVAEDEEIVDALDAAISLNDLDEELASPALFDQSEVAATKSASSFVGQPRKGSRANGSHGPMVKGMKKSLGKAPKAKPSGKKKKK